MTAAELRLKALDEASPDPATPPRWLLLFHQIPPRPSYVRVKIWRRLQALGAVPVKNSVYALPRSERAFEDFQWVLRAITAERGDGSVCEARFVDGLTDAQIEALFVKARDADYAAIAGDARALAKKLGARVLGPKALAGLEAAAARLSRRLAETIAIDFCDASGRQATEGLVSELGRILAARKKPKETSSRASGARSEPVRGATWVTRVGVHIDRIASAWLIRRSIDPAARFKFVPAKGYVPEPGELRFDMFEAEYTHEGDLCTFEVLLRRFRVDDPALAAIGEIVHDIDLKDGKFGRPETIGVHHAVDGIAMSTRVDEARIAQASPLFEGLHAYFGPKRSAPLGRGKASRERRRT
jgi:hypothetical protein